MSTGHILILGLIAGLTIFIGLPMGRLQGVSLGVKAFLSATATGILLFLLWDVLSAAVEPIEEALNARDWGQFSGYSALAFTGRELGSGPERDEIPGDVRASPGGYRSFHFWHSGYHGGK